MAKHALTLLFVLFQLSLNALAASPKSAREYWADTGYLFAYVEGDLNQSHCSRSPQYFLGCVQAINTLLSFNEPAPLALVASRTLLKRRAEIARVVQRFKTVSIVEFNQAAVGTRGAETVQHRQARRRDFRQEWLPVFEAVKLSDQAVPFAEIIETAKRLVITPQNEAFVAGMTENTYLAAAEDSHAYLVPTALWEDVMRSPDAAKPLADDAIQKRVTVEHFVHRGQTFGYIRLSRFGSLSDCGEIASATQKMVRSGVRGLILDLRGNSGGLLEVAACVSSIYLPAGKIVATQKSLNPVDPMYADQVAVVSTASFQNQRLPVTTTLPMAVLINAQSASASEIVAGALQDYQRAFIVGERSFGKGSVQAIGVIQSNPKLMRAETVARFYLPSGRTNQLVGIVPDVQVSTSQIAEREEDLFPNSLPAEGGKWRQPRAGLMARLRACISNTASKNDEPNHQRSMAAEVLRCADDLSVDP